MYEVITNSVTGEVTVREFTPEEVEARNARALAEWRETAQCTRMQGVLALGEARWSAILAYRETATWAEKVVIDASSDWHRSSQDIEFFGYLLGLSDEEIDALFLSAMQIAP